MFVHPSASSEFDKYDEPRLHMEQLLKARLFDLGLSMKILIILEKAGIRTLGDLVKKTRPQLLKIPQLGVLSADAIEKMLDRYALSLAK